MDFGNFFASTSSLDDLFGEKTTKKTASDPVVKIRVASSKDLSGFVRVSSNTLVHVSQKDFWHLGQDDNGYFIERLVDDSDGPVNG